MSTSLSTLGTIVYTCLFYPIKKILVKQLEYLRNNNADNWVNHLFFLNWNIFKFFEVGFILMIDKMHDDIFLFLLQNMEY